MSERSPLTASDAEVDEFATDFMSFLRDAPSSYHAAAEVARQLEAEGFHRLRETDSWNGVTASNGKFVVVRDGAVIAWVVPETVDATTPVRIVGSHTDSPGFTVKPGHDLDPTFEAHGFTQLGVEIYGGPVLDTWFDRELEFAGHLIDRERNEYLVRSGAVARIPQLAIHLDRSANEGRTIDRQRHTQPILGVSEVDLMGHLAEFAVSVESGQTVKLTAQDIAGFDLLSVDAQPAARFGTDARMLASGRLDNLTSVFASLEALKHAATHPEKLQHIAILAAFDHEEVGSGTRSGASGPFLSDVLGRLFEQLGANRDQRAQALAASWCISADAAHSVNPNFAERYDPKVYPVLGSGPALKFNANQRYATDAQGSAFWRALSERASVPVQEFVSNNQVPAGSTIGPLTATRLGIRTIDVGVPLLSMHSARELCDLYDLAAFTRVLREVYA